MKIDKKDLEKALIEMKFIQEKENKYWWNLGSMSIQTYVLSQLLEKIPEETERKEEHKHKWQVLERTPMWDKNKGVYVGGFIFVCPCGAIKRVKEKGVEE